MCISKRREWLKWRGVEANIQPEDWALGMRCGGRTIHTTKFLGRRAGLGVRRRVDASCSCHVEHNPIKESLHLGFPLLGSSAPTCSNGLLTSFRHLLKHHLLREAFPNRLSLSVCPDLWFLALLKLRPMLCSIFICLLSCLLR